MSDTTKNFIKSLSWTDSLGVENNADIGVDAENVFITVGSNKINLQEFFKNYESMRAHTKYIHVDAKAPTQNQENIIWIDTNGTL